MEIRSREKKQVDMIHGPLSGKILLFSIPLIASGILQQSFNAIDVAVIGHYSTTQAIAAVGSNGPIISILVNLFLGVAVGANAVIATYLGQKNHNSVRKSSRPSPLSLWCRASCLCFWASRSPARFSKQ